ncbi:MAG: SynChlorMet cassette radical SAM/SPASM protein ScmE [Candidatus Riflebacteria bacterium]|nr:SynChlorMet cassette radical SAM/SPASM protein ScmE [Candidatus Riflebacteria bacterium]
MRTPRSIDIEITARCNLRCRYCYFFNNPAMEYRDLPANEWLDLFDELGSLGVMQVTLAGGEPFIRTDLTEILESIVRNRMRFSLLSNGALIDDRIASFIAGTGRCDYVQISVDGSSSKIHDSCRGEGSFDGAIRGIRTLQRNRVNVAVRVTLHRNNVCDLENITKFLLNDLGLASFSTNSAGYMGACRLNSADLLLNTQDRQTAMTTLLSLNEIFQGRISANAGPLAEGRMWRRMEDARSQGAPSFSNGGRLTGCGCTSSKLAVRSDGVIVPCNMLAHIELGRINQNCISEIWQHNHDLNRLRNRHTISLSDFSFCDGCSYISYCTGNCPGLAYSIMGNAYHPSPDACFRRFIEANGTIP